jgi:hypothetical protein
MLGYVRTNSNDETRYGHYRRRQSPGTPGIRSQITVACPAHPPSRSLADRPQADFRFAAWRDQVCAMSLRGLFGGEWLKKLTERWIPTNMG